MLCTNSVLHEKEKLTHHEGDTNANSTDPIICMYVRFS